MKKLYKKETKKEKIIRTNKDKEKLLEDVKEEIIVK